MAASQLQPTMSRTFLQDNFPFPHHFHPLDWETGVVVVEKKISSYVLLYILLENNEMRGKWI